MHAKCSLKGMQLSNTVSAFGVAVLIFCGTFYCTLCAGCFASIWSMCLQLLVQKVVYVSASLAF